MAGGREELHYVVSSKATMTHIPVFWTMGQPGHLIPLIIPLALFCPLFCSFYVTCQGYRLNMFLSVRVRNGLNKLRSGFVLQPASVCPNKVR